MLSAGGCRWHLRQPRHLRCRRLRSAVAAESGSTPAARARAVRRPANNAAHQGSPADPGSSARRADGRRDEQPCLAAVFGLRHARSCQAELEMGCWRHPAMALATGRGPRPTRALGLRPPGLNERRACAQAALPVAWSTNTPGADPRHQCHRPRCECVNSASARPCASGTVGLSGSCSTTRTNDQRCDGWRLERSDTRVSADDPMVVPTC